MLIGNLRAERKVVSKQREIESSLRRELEQKEKLGSVTKIAYTDNLTGLRSKHAFAEAAEAIDKRIAEKTMEDFAFVFFDLNDLKEINDAHGHEAGDKYFQDSCEIICRCFAGCSVYRIGGDEFVAILEAEIYNSRQEMLYAFNKEMTARTEKGQEGVAAGMACYQKDTDNCCHDVLERADEQMYQKKKQMKGA